jgi:hypothetical protein
LANIGFHREAAADPQVEARPQLGVVNAHERDVVDLVDNVHGRRAGNGGLELAWQVGELWAADVFVPDLLDGPGAVDNLVRRDSRDR